MSVLIDTNILIYHTQGAKPATEFLNEQVIKGSFHISILTKIEFLGWDKHTPEGFKKCNQLIELSNVFPMGDNIANKAIELRRGSKVKMKLADAVMAATALLNNLALATRNTDDFKGIEGLEIINPFA